MRQRVTSKPRESELATMVGDMAVDVALAVVVVRAEVDVARAGVGQRLVVDLQLGVPGGDAGCGRAAPAGQPPMADALAGLGAARERGEGAPRYRLPFWRWHVPAFAGLVACGARPPQEEKLHAGAEPGYVHAGFGDGVLPAFRTSRSDLVHENGAWAAGMLVVLVGGRVSRLLVGLDERLDWVFVLVRRLGWRLGRAWAGPGPARSGCRAGAWSARCSAGRSRPGR